MSDGIQSGMAEATRLVQEGRLAEATAIIQSTLGGGHEWAARSDGFRSGGDESIDVESSIVGDATSSGAAGETVGSHGTAPAAVPLFGGLSSTTMPEGLYMTIPDSGMPLTMPTMPTMPLGSPGAPEREGDPGVAPTGGRYLERTYTDGAGTRSYKLYVPSGYIGQEVPLIVMLHGCTQSPDDIAAGTRMNAIAEENIFLVAYPAQAQGANMNRCWNWFKSSDQQRGRGEPSLIAGITRRVVDEYNVADDRVYVAGMSAGGAMAAVMGETYPDLYAAVGIHSGLAPGAAHDMPSAFAAMQGGGPQRRDIPEATATEPSARAVPVILFHGDCDKTVHPRNAEHLLSYYCNGSVGGRATPRATVRRGSVPDGHAYTRVTYRDAGGRAIVERWTIHGLGHAWSGGSSSGSFTDARGPDAAAEMVRFFGQHPLRERPESPAD